MIAVGDLAREQEQPAGPRFDAARLALLLTLPLWLAHAALYTFVTDDAFISFRYARNLSQGFGLVFNPGLERVEGYTNFLFVLLLAGLDRVGLTPERAASGVLWLSTIALWWLIQRWSRQRAPEAGGRWLAIVPLLLLGLSRPIAVWTTSGLETRLFELLVVAGLMRLVVEARRLERGDSPGAPLAGLALGLAALTRPDGALIGACAFAGAGLALARRRGVAGLIALPGRAAPFLALIVAHTAFRLAYYGAWVPNTYFAKVGGRTMWGSGAEYLTAFALENFAALWIPLALLGAWRCARRGETVMPLVWLAGVVPHVLYVAAIGGDHFEYRPLGLLLIAGMLGAYEAVLLVWERGVPRFAIALGVLALGASLLWMPMQSHAQFPSSYEPGYPGLAGERGREFLSAARTPGGNLPVLGALLAATRERLASLTSRYVGVRQEEHRWFRQEVEGEAQRLRALIRRGALAPDARVAMGSVGVIPYVTNLPTLDVLGLTDAHVARGPFESERIGHGKHATLDYARERGVELWFEGGLRLLRSGGSSGMIRLALASDADAEGLWVADAGDGWNAVARLPRGEAGAARAAPGLRFEALADRAARRALVARLLAWHEEASKHDPASPEIARRIAALRSKHATLEAGR